MLNTMQSTFAGGPRRFLMVPVLGAAAIAALAALAVGANGLPLGIGTTAAAATKACPAVHSGPSVPCPHAPRFVLPVIHLNQPGPMGPLTRVAIGRQPASPMTPAQIAFQRNMRGDLQALFGGPSTPVILNGKPKS
jgi:hypothetical protein